MRQFFVIILSAFLFTGCGIWGNMSNCSMSYNKYIDGYWGNWNIFNQFSRASFYGTPGNFIVYAGHRHKSDYSLKIVANNCYLSSKDKQAIKSRRWYEYKGYITYRHYEQKSSKEYIRDFDYVLTSGPYEITRPATIKVFPMKDRYCYNIYFDGVGIGLNIPWQIAR